MELDKLGVVTSFIHNIVVYNIPLLYGTVGEIVISGPTIMAGYLTEDGPEDAGLYTDENGVKRTRTNPTYADFARAGMYPKRYKEGVPDYDPETERVEEVFEIKDGYFEITYKIKEED